MLKKNPEREASLLDEWKKGTSAREAARIAGVPEGTVYYYWKRFNRDPEKANRLATSLKPSRKLSDMDILLQSDKIRLAEEVAVKYDSLIKEGKFVQAEYYIRALRQAEQYRNEQRQGINSYLAMYLANPGKYGILVFQAAQEILQREMDKGMALPDAISSSTVAVAQLTHDPDVVRTLVAALQVLKTMYPTLQEAEKPEERVSLGELVDQAEEREKKELERKRRETKAKGKRVLSTPLTFGEPSTWQPPDSLLPGRLDSSFGGRLHELIEDQPAKKPKPER